MVPKLSERYPSISLLLHISFNSQMQMLLIIKPSDLFKAHKQPAIKRNLPNPLLAPFLSFTVARFHCTVARCKVAKTQNWNAAAGESQEWQGMPPVAHSAKQKDEFLSTSNAPNHETGVSGATWWVQITLSSGRNNVCLWTTSGTYPKES